MATKTPNVLLYSNECWENSHLSVARHFGQVRVNGYRYVIVNKEGKDLWECSNEARILGRDKAIPAGEPADLIWDKLHPAYRTLKRDKIISLLKEGKTFDEIKKIATDEHEERKKRFEARQTELHFPLT